VSLNTTDTYDWKAWYENESGTAYVKFAYSDPDDDTTDLNVAIYEQGNKSNEIYNSTFSGPLGNVSVSQPLTGDETNKTWIVDWSADRGGETIDAKVTVGKQVIEQFGELPSWLRNAIAIFFVIITAGLFSQLNAETGAVTASLVGGGFWMMAWLPAEAGGAIVVALFLALIFKYATVRT
jgi:hypothetical protein